MGGTVRLAIRFPNGKVDSFNTWTNWLPHQINDVALVNVDSSHFENMVKMMEDNNDERASVAPYGYGLIVVDLKEKLILSMQGYTSFGDDVAARFSISSNSKDQVDRCKKWIECGRAYMSDRCKPDIPPILLTSFDQIVNAGNDPQNPRAYTMIHYDLRPFQYIEYEETKKGGNAFKNKLKALGFEVNDSEWKEHFLDMGH